MQDRNGEQVTLATPVEALPWPRGYVSRVKRLLARCNVPATVFGLSVVTMETIRNHSVFVKGAGEKTLTETRLMKSLIEKAAPAPKPHGLFYWQWSLDDLVVGASTGNPVTLRQWLVHAGTSAERVEIILNHKSGMLEIVEL